MLVSPTTSAAPQFPSPDGNGSSAEASCPPELQAKARGDGGPPASDRRRLHRHAHPSHRHTDRMLLCHLARDYRRSQNPPAMSELVASRAAYFRAQAALMQARAVTLSLKALDQVQAL